MVVLAAVIVQMTLLFAPAQGQESRDNWLADLRGGIANSLESSRQNQAIQRSVLGGLDRETSGSELQGDRRGNEGYDRTSDNIRQRPPSASGLPSLSPGGEQKPRFDHPSDL